MSLPFLARGLLASSSSYSIGRSLRLRSSAPGFLTRTLAGASTSTTIFTWAGWIKRGTLPAARSVVAYHGATPVAGNVLSIEFNSTGQLVVNFDATPTTQLITSAIFRDPTAWYHVVLAYSSGLGTASQRARLYVNGTEITSFATANYPASSQAIAAGSGNVQVVGGLTGPASTFDGSLAEIYFIDGQQLTPSAFGAFDGASGAWVPRRYASGFGGNSYYLDFSDPTSAATLAADRSTPALNFTASGVSVTAGATYDSSLDTPSNNHPIVNPLQAGVIGYTVSGGGLTVATGNNTGAARGTFAMTTGQWYCEVTITSSNANDAVGIVEEAASVLNAPGANATSYAYYATGQKFNANALTTYTGAASFTTGDVIGIHFNGTAGTLEFFKNGTSQGVAFTGIPAGTYFFAFGDGATGSSCTHDVNFGQRPFTGSLPSGAAKLSASSLPVPLVLKGSSVYDEITYTGTGASLSPSGLAFQPELVWIKGRSGATDHAIYDAVRGTTADIGSNLGTAETTQATGLTAFGTSGFTVGTLAKLNTSAATYVAWCWKETGSPVLDIVTYTGDGTSGRTIAHALGVVPTMIIIKARSAAQQWMVYHSKADASPATVYLSLNGTAAGVALTGAWNNTLPTSAVFSLGNDLAVNGNGTTYVAYLFADVPGISRMGSYVGNGVADGPFVYTGFRPAFVMMKNATTAGTAWVMVDSRRDLANPEQSVLNANAATAEASSVAVDFLANGFKVRATGADRNSNGALYVYAAFAETPFKFSNAR